MDGVDLGDPNGHFFSPILMPPGDGVEKALTQTYLLPLLLLLLLSPGTRAGPGASSHFALGLPLNYMALRS